MIRFFSAVTLLSICSAIAGCGGGSGTSPTTPINTEGGLSLSLAVSGLPNSSRMVFRLNNTEAQPITGSGNLTFTKRFSSGESYSVEIQSIPAGLICGLTNASGTVARSSIAVNVSCSDTPQKVALVKDVNTNATQHSSSPSDFSVFNGRVVFTIDGGAATNIKRLISTDGSGRPVPLFERELRNPSVVGTLGTRLLFTETVGPPNDESRQLSIYEDSSGHTQSMIGLNVERGAAIGQSMLFFANDEAQFFGYEPWVSDGTPSGTRMVRDLNPGRASSVDQVPDVHVLGGQWSFIAYNEGNTRLWLSDATENGTQPVTRSNLRVKSILGVHRDRLYFLADQGVGTEAAIWATNGTPGAEFLFHRLAADGEGFASCFFNATNGFYYSTRVGSGFQTDNFVWFSTGDNVAPIPVPGAENSVSLLRIYSAACGLVELNGKVFFGTQTAFDDKSLWTSDGTPEGTRQISTGVYGYQFPEKFVILGLPDRVIFPRVTVEHGTELWWTDGSRIELLADIEPGSASGLTDGSEIKGVVADGRAYFAAQTRENGIEPWTSDGSGSGTVTLGNLQAETRTHDGVSRVLGHTSAGVYFSGCEATINDCELWISDGSDTGTRKVLEINDDFGSNPRQALAYRDRFYFTAEQGGLWVSDGTTLGTRRLRSIHYTELHPTEAGLIISGLDQTQPGVELWRTDGTENGTVPLAEDISPSSHDERAGGLVTAGNWVYYSTSGPNGRLGLRRTDPATGASEFIGETNITRNPETRPIALGNRVVFSASDRDSGSELWQFDGARISRITDINTGFGNSDPYALTAFGNEVWFIARDEEALALWAFDGTNVRKIIAAPRFTEGFRQLSVINNKLYLVADAYQDGSQFSVFDSPSAHIRPLRTQDGARLQPRVIRRLNSNEVFLADARDRIFRPFVADERRVVQLDTSVEIRDVEETLMVPDGPTAGIWFKGYSAAEGIELWRLR